MGRLTTNRERRNDGMVRHPSSVDGLKYTHRDMVRDYQRQKYRRMRAEQLAERAADKEGCFGVVLMLVIGAGSIVATALQVMV